MPVTNIIVVLNIVLGILFTFLSTIIIHFRYRVGAFFFMIMNMVFGNLSAIDLFIKERKIFM